MKYMNKGLLYTGNDYVIVNGVIQEALENGDIIWPDDEVMPKTQVNDAIAALNNQFKSDVNVTKGAMDLKFSTLSDNIDALKSKIDVIQPTKATEDNVDYSLLISYNGSRVPSVVNSIDGYKYEFSSTPVDGGTQLITVTDSDGKIQLYGNCKTTLISNNYAVDVTSFKYTALTTSSVPVVYNTAETSYAAIVLTTGPSNYPYTKNIKISGITNFASSSAQYDYDSVNNAVSLFTYSYGTKFVGKVYKLTDGSTVDLSKYNNNSFVTVILADGRQIAVVNI